MTDKKTKKKCANCDKPAEADRYKYCYDCWWKQDPRNSPDWEKHKGNAGQNITRTKES